MEFGVLDLLNIHVLYGLSYWKYFLFICWLEYGVLGIGNWELGFLDLFYKGVLGLGTDLGSELQHGVWR